MDFAARSTVGQPSFDRDGLAFVSGNVFDVGSGHGRRSSLALCEFKRFGQPIKYDLKSVPGANGAREHTGRIAAVGDLEHERPGIADLPHRGQCRWPVDGALKRDEMVITAATVVMYVGRDEMSGEQLSGLRRATEQMCVTKIQTNA